MEELQVVGLGATTEYGEFTGSAANFVTKSGSNEFHGLLEYRKVPNASLVDRAEVFEISEYGRALHESARQRLFPLLACAPNSAGHQPETSGL